MQLFLYLRNVFKEFSIFKLYLSPILKDLYLWVKPDTDRKGKSKCIDRLLTLGFGLFMVFVDNKLDQE